METDHTNLKIFKQHGFIKQGDSGANQVIGRCPFCGKNKKFFINPEKKTWDCKVCSHKGGYQMFLKQIVSHCCENFTDARAEKLSLSRGISVETLRDAHVGYNPLRETYTIPVWDRNKKDIYNIRIYRKDGVLMNSAGCKAALYGWWELNSEHNVIWLCEGEWDALAMRELLNKNNLQEAIVLALPGATNLNNKWIEFFSKKIVHVLLDNDYDILDGDVFKPGAGKLGMKKIHENISTIVKSVDYVHWPRIYPDGFDLRDLYKKKKGNANRTLKQVVAMMQPKPPVIEYPEGLEPQDEKDKKEREKGFDGEGMLPEEIYRRYRNWLYLPDATCIDVAFGSVIANRLKGPPVWLFLIGPSGCGKSELIMSMDDAPRIFPLSRMTPNTLISGSQSAGGGDPSLIPKLNNMILSIKDFTVILEMNEQARDAIVSQLRDAYDGKCANGFGTGAIRHYESTFGIQAGVTNAIEIYLEGGTAMGERFIGYKFASLGGFKEECKIMGKAIDNVTEEEETEMRADLRDVGTAVLNFDFGKAPRIPPDIKQKLMALAYFVGNMRGTVKRNRYSREIERKAFIERPTRLAVQFAKLMMGITLFKRKRFVTDAELDILKVIAMGTAPEHLEVIVRGMWLENKNGSYTDKDFADMLRLPAETCKRFAENLYQLGILRLKKPKGAMLGTWHLSKSFIDVITDSEIYLNLKKG